MSKHNRGEALYATQHSTPPAKVHGAWGVMKRRRWFGLAAVAGVALGGAWFVTAAPAEAGEITVYKSPTCGCCEQWLGHIRDAGFQVTEQNLSDVTVIKKKYGVPAQLYSCHTGLVGGYVIEGHVPADLIKRLLDEKPAVVGLAVAGMPAGAPGMESTGKEPYEVLTFTRTGETATYAVR